MGAQGAAWRPTSFGLWAVNRGSPRNVQYFRSNKALVYCSIFFQSRSAPPQRRHLFRAASPPTRTTYPDRNSIVRSNIPVRAPVALFASHSHLGRRSPERDRADGSLQQVRRPSTGHEGAQTPPRSPSNLRPKTLSERLRLMSPAEPVQTSAVARAPAWSSALALFSFSIGRTFRASLHR